ncbi:MAG: hypothetical protein K5857_02445 [Lachnospiraceae bacterium]|nr:hypothetical protein [Lachnospiraceae bacterium]
MNSEGAKLNRKRTGAILLFLFSIFMVLYYILAKERIEFDSDFTDTILWAEAMLTGNGLFDPKMYYAYTLPFGGSLLMMPFVAVFGVGYTAHALGFILFFAIFVFSLYKFLRSMDFSVEGSMIAAAVILLMSLPTKDTRMIMWGHVIHYSLGLLFVMIATAVCSGIDLKLPAFLGENRKGSLLLIILTALFCTNGLTTILFFFIPFYGALILERFVNIKDELLCTENKNTAALSIAGLCAAGGGFILSALVQRLSGVTTVYESLFKTIPTWQEWVWDFMERLRVMLVCTAGELSAQTPMESTTGIRVMYMAFVSMVVIATPLIAFFAYRRIENKNIRIYMLSHIILLLSTLFIYDFSLARGTAHRMVGLYMTAVTVTVIFMMWLLKEGALARFGALLAIILSVACLFSVYGVVSLRGQNRYDGLIAVLRDNDLHRGYAEYWSAQVTTVLSDQDITVAPVIISEEGEITPRMYNSRKDQFEAEEGIDRYFAFLSAWEYETTKDTVCKDASKVIPYDEDGYIVIFDHNLF